MTQTWEGVRQDVGAGTKPWPRLDEPGWFAWFWAPRIRTLGDAVPFVIALFPSDRKKTKSGGWTRSQISAQIHALICEQFGMQRHQYAENMTWDEMGID